jgi:hypothetical protein
MYFFHTFFSLAIYGMNCGWNPLLISWLNKEKSSIVAQLIVDDILKYTPLFHHQTENPLKDLIKSEEKDNRKSI